MAKRTQAKATGPDGKARQAAVVRSEAGHVSLRHQFEEFARRRAAGEILVPPGMLPDEERRLHIRQTLLEDHAFRIKNRPEGAQGKFDRLTQSPFVFFRGTSLLYYRDHAGTDSHLPTVLAVGDVHPENFGVMPNEDGAPFFGLDDFDEAAFAPFSWDVKRGAVGFVLAGRENGLGRKQRRHVVESWAGGYFEGLREFARGDREATHQFRLDNSPPMIRRLIEASLKERRAFLEKMIDLGKRQFLTTDEIVPHSKHVAEFQAAVDEYRRGSDIDVRGRAGHFQVRDVAIKKGSGTASLGLDRYLVLIDGPTDDTADDVVLEFKQARQSALANLVAGALDDGEAVADRIVRSHQIHLAGGDAYYGRTTLDGHEFVVRERSPFKARIKIESLSVSEAREYARVCAFVLAQAHARADEDTGILEGNVEKRILKSVDEPVFTADVARFAEAAADRVRNDFRLFKQDYKIGAYRLIRSL